MKLSDFLCGLGKPFAYHPQLAILLGGVNRAVLLCRLAWWHRETEGEWIAKTMDEIRLATGLSKEEQRTARRQLKAAGLLKEECRRLQHEMRYRLDFNALDALWAAHEPEAPDVNSPTSPSRESPSPEVGKVDLGESGKLISTIDGKDGSKDGSKDREAPPLPPEAQTWNELCGELPKVLTCSPSRLKHLQARRRDQFWRDNFRAAVEKVAASDFCRGASDRGWRASFDWLVERPDALAKVMEGKYDNHERKTAGGARAPEPRDDHSKGAWAGTEWEDLEKLRPLNRLEKMLRAQGRPV